MSTTGSGQVSPAMQQCADLCLECYVVCSQALMYCLQRGGEYAKDAHIRLLNDCAEICHTSASFLLRGSTFHARTCADCAEICSWCAQQCEILADDVPLEACAKACRRCAQACRRLAGITV